MRNTNVVRNKTAMCDRRQWTVETTVQRQRLFLTSSGLMREYEIVNNLRESKTEEIGGENRKKQFFITRKRRKRT